MATKKVELHLPEGLFDALGGEKDAERRTLQALLLSLIQEGKVTASYAAEVLGISYHEMLDVMTQHNVPLVNYSPDELDKEIENLNKLLD